MDNPEIVYKYRHWSDPFHRKVLLENELFLASPICFNDPFDCRITTNYLLLDTPEKREEYIQIGMKKHATFLSERGLDLDSVKSDLQRRIDDLESFQREHDEIEVTEMNKCYGVVSLSARWDSILMWSHYADHHRGFCIGFNEEKIQNSGLFGKGGMVNYSNSYPSIDPREEYSMEQSFVHTHTKAEDWKYEQEYRLMNMFYPIPATNDADRIVKVPDEFIEEVIIGLHIPSNHRSEILSECKRRSIPVFQTIKVPRRFNLDRVTVD